MKLDFATVLGFFTAVLLVFMGMFLAAGADMALLVALYLNQPASAAITVGGSVGGTILSFPFYRLKLMGKVISRAIMADPKNTAYADLIIEMVDYATDARRNGVLALDARTESIEDPFIKHGVQLAVDGTAPEQIEEIMQLELEALAKRHEDNQGMFMKWAELAPAFGMLGTLIGLIAMLANLSDPDTIGPSMAIALVTTMYGSMVANMFCIPLAAKLQAHTKEELTRREIIISAILSIQNGDNPRIVQQKLLTYVPQDIKDIVNEGSGET